jgi:hypothetical protein
MKHQLDSLLRQRPEAAGTEVVLSEAVTRQRQKLGYLD